MPSHPASGSGDESPKSADTSGSLSARAFGELLLDTGTLADGPEAGKAPAPTPEELAPLFPQLEILGLLGRGGMGVVYKARQKALGRLVALKLLDPARTGDPAFATRFAAEARLLAGLAHPNIVTVFDFGETGGRHYLLMEYVDGVNLRHAMRADRFTPEQALAIIPPVCDALQYAHDRGVVHRDIKPENILLDRDGRVKIADFGIAKLMRDDGPDTGAAETRAGTPAYASPEQRTGAAADRRADIWSLGVILYELLTGELPTALPQPPSKKVRLDVRIDEIVLRALETSPELRYKTAVDMKTRLEEVTEGKAAGIAPPLPDAPAKPAGLRRRIAAALIDYWLVSILVFPVLLLIAKISPGSIGVSAPFDLFATGHEHPSRIMSTNVFNTLMLFLWWILFENSPLQASPGKLAMGIRITDRQGKRPTLGATIIRNLFKPVSIFVFWLGYLRIAFLPKKEGWHDEIAKCRTEIADDSPYSLFALSQSVVGRKLWFRVSMTLLIVAGSFLTFCRQIFESPAPPISIGPVTLSHENPDSQKILKESRVEKTAQHAADLSPKTVPAPSVGYLAWVQENRPKDPDAPWLPAAWRPDGTLVKSENDRKTIGAIYSGLPGTASEKEPILYILGKNFYNDRHSLKTIALRNDKVTPVLNEHARGTLVARAWAPDSEKIWTACFFGFPKDAGIPDTTDILLEYGEGEWSKTLDVPAGTVTKKGTHSDMPDEGVMIANGTTRGSSGRTPLNSSITCAWNDRIGYQTEIRLVLNDGRTVRTRIGVPYVIHRGSAPKVDTYLCNSEGVTVGEIARIQRFDRPTYTKILRNVPLHPSERSRVENEAAAKTYALDWLATVDSGGYEKSWESLDHAAKPVSRPDWVAFMKTERDRKRGTVISRNLASSEWHSGSRNLAMEFLSVFSHDDVVVHELVVIHVAETGEKTVSNYDIANPTPADAARICADRWIAGLDAGKFAENYRNAAPVLRKAITEADWTMTQNLVRRPLGKITYRRLISEAPAPLPAGSEEVALTVIRYRTGFAGAGEMVETVAISRFADGREAVSGYYIRPAPDSKQSDTKPAADSR